MAARQASANALEHSALDGSPSLAGRVELEAFGGLDEALAYLYRRWVTYLGAAIEAEAGREGEEPIAAVRRGWRRVTGEHPGLLAILVRHSEAPAVAVADARHRRHIATVAGCRPDELPSFHDIAAMQAELAAALTEDGGGLQPLIEEVGDQPNSRGGTPARTGAA